MSEELDILKLVCQRLEASSIPYMLTGSFAANFYAVPRMTRDIDIVIAIQEEDIIPLFEIFKGDFYIDRESISEAIKNQSMFNIIHNNTVFKIDFIVRKNETYRKIEFQRRHQVMLDNILLWIVSPEDLIISKLFWAKDSFSEMQLKDVNNLLMTIKNLDKNYIDKWIQHLNLHEVFQKVQFNA